ncbi:hypothetical protein PO909_017694 [Leuciscus waleckii]
MMMKMMMMMCGRCSVQKNCSSGTLSRSWISSADGVQQCPSMTITPSEISYSAHMRDVGILMDGSVPDLQGLRVECGFGVGISTNATVHLDFGTTKIQTCPLPPPHIYPTIPLGKDHITVPVAIKVNGVPVVSGSFIIYECERMGAIHLTTAGQGSGLGVRFRGRGTALDCDFGDGQLYGAQWLDGSSVNCSGVTLKTTMWSQIFHLNLRRRGTNTYIDSPKPMTVEVYSCGAGDSDCSQCRGRETQGHMCVWCHSECRHRDQCQTITAHCPDPHIQKIEPLTGPLMGGTLLTVQGRNLGHRVDHVNVSIGKVPCYIQHYTVSVRLVCETGASWETMSDHVTVSVSGNAVGVSKDVFSFVEPRLLEFSPPHGPLAGGTRLTIRGQFLDAGSTVSVRINTTQDCSIYMRSSKVIGCVMPPAALAENVSVCVVYDGRPCLSTSPNFTFTYEKNPTISQITPSKSFLSGGRRISVTGYGFGLVQLAVMEVTGIGQTNCSCVSSTLMVCQSPAAAQSQQATALFYLNQVLYRGEGSSGDRGPDEDQEPLVEHFHFDYVEDPQFYTANKEKLIKHHTGEPLILVINRTRVTVVTRDVPFRKGTRTASLDTLGNEIPTLPC